MNTNHNTGKQTITHNLEYEKYTELETDLNKMIETLEYNLNTPISNELLEGLKQFEITIFNMRNDYDNKRFR